MDDCILGEVWQLEAPKCLHDTVYVSRVVTWLRTIRQRFSLRSEAGTTTELLSFEGLPHKSQRLSPPCLVCITKLSTIFDSEYTAVFYSTQPSVVLGCHIYHLVVSFLLRWNLVLVPQHHSQQLPVPCVCVCVCGVRECVCNVYMCV